MYEQILEDVLCQDYSNPYSKNTGSGIRGKNTDIKTGKIKNYCYSPPLYEVDTSSINPPHFEIRMETVLGLPKKKDILTHITQIVNKLMEEETFRELDKEKVEDFKRIIENNIPLEQFEILSDEELLKRFRKALGIELMCGLLKDLNEEQIKIFESAIKRRDLFK